MNYFLYKLIVELRKKGRCHSYTEISRFIAELNENKAEIRRRILANHEDEAIKNNDDVT